MTEPELNDEGIYIEPYAGGLMVADYRNGERARYYGSDLEGRRQPITYSPFPDKTSAVAAAGAIENGTTT